MLSHCYYINVPSPMPKPSSASVPLLAIIMLILGALGVATAWLMVSGFRQGQASAWMAVVAALDVVVMLRLGGAKAGWIRALLAVAGTLFASLLAYWAIIALHIGAVTGQTLIPSMQRLGSSLGWTYFQLLNQPEQIAWLVAGLVVAFILGR